MLASEPAVFSEPAGNLAARVGSAPKGNCCVTLFCAALCVPGTPLLGLVASLRLDPLAIMRVCWLPLACPETEWLAASSRDCDAKSAVSVKLGVSVEVAVIGSILDLSVFAKRSLSIWMLLTAAVALKRC